MQVKEAAPALLAAFVAQLEAQDIAVPTRRYVSPGQAAVWDGEQLVLLFQDLLRGQPAAAIEGTTYPQATSLWAEFNLQLVRPAPALQGEAILEAMIPDEAQIDSAGLEAMADADALRESVLAIQQAHTVTEPTMGFAWGPISSLGPEGGFSAMQLKLAISLA